MWYMLAGIPNTPGPTSSYPGPRQKAVKGSHTARTLLPKFHTAGQHSPVGSAPEQLAIPGLRGLLQRSSLHPSVAGLYMPEMGTSTAAAAAAAEVGASSTSEQQGMAMSDGVHPHAAGARAAAAAAAALAAGGDRATVAEMPAPTAAASAEEAPAPGSSKKSLALRWLGSRLGRFTSRAATPMTAGVPT